MPSVELADSGEKGTEAGATFPDALLRQVREATDRGRYLDAYNNGLQAGPLETWAGPEAKLLAGRLSRNLGGSDLPWRLISQAYRQRPRLARYLTQRIYSVTEKRGLFSAWEMSRRLEKCESEDDIEKAEALVCRADLHVPFRDFQTATRFFKEAQLLAPLSPWVWTECSALLAEQGEHASALRCVDYALELQPWFRPAVQRKAQYLQILGRDEEALRLLDSARQHIQSFSVVLQLLTIHSEQENWPQVLELLEEARHLAPFAEKGLKLHFTIKEVDALTGLGEWERAAAKADEVPKIKFYENLTRNLRTTPPPGKRVKLQVPYIRQDYNTCAPATLSAITAFWGRQIPQETLVDAICYDGTTDFAERRWVEQNGWFAREFKVTWEASVALLDLGIPFILSTTEIESGHAQAVMGYDTVRQSLLIRDPNLRHHTEAGYSEFAKHYEPVGPRGLLVLPKDKAHLVAGIDLPESDIYDFYFRLNCALDEFDRPKAEAALQEIEQRWPNHRLYWTGRRVLASYDQNPVLHLEAVDHLRTSYPGDDRLISLRVRLLRLLGRNVEAMQMLRERLAKPNVPPSFWLEYDQELNGDVTRSNYAIRVARRSLKHNPCNFAALGSLASHLWSGYHRDAALDVQRLAASLGDKKEFVAQNYFQMLLVLGRSTEGLKYLHRRARHLLPRSGDPTLTYAQALDQLFQTQEAREVLQAALTQRPNDGDIMLFAAKFESAAGHNERSFQLLESASSKSKKITWLRSAARLYRRVGNYDQSLQYWNEVAANSPLDVEAQREVALLLARRDGKKAGEEYIQSVGRRFPLHVGLLQQEIGWLRENRREEVERRVAEFVRVNPYNAWAQRELALALYHRQANEEALERARFARQIDPYNADSWQTEGVMLERMERESEARENYRQALSLRIDSDMALRRLVLLADTVDKKIEELRFVRQQIENQKIVGPAINAYREVAFGILGLEELTENIRDIWHKRPDRWEAWNAMSIQLLAVGNVSEAEQVATEATKRFPLLATAWRHSGIVKEQRDRWDDAIQCFRVARQIEPEWTAAILSLAEAYRRSGRLPDALSLLEQGHLRNPLDSTILGTWADLLWHSGKREEAIQHVQKAVDLNPDYQWGWNALSRWSDVVLHKNLALELCRERAKRLRSDADAWLWVAQLASLPDQMAEQLAAAQRAAECDPRHAGAHDWVAVALVRQRRFDEALEACRPAVFGTKIPSLLRGREAWILAQQGHLQQAIDAMMAVLRVDPQYYWGWEQVANWNQQKKDDTAALHACERLIRLAPASPQGYILRAQIHAAGNKRESAKKDYRRALALVPGSLAAGWKLIRLQLEDREFAEADQTISILQPHVSPGVIMPAKIIAAAQRNRVDEAIELFAQAAVLPEIDVNALNEAVGVIDKLGRGDSLNTKLGSVMKDPALNPVFAAMWVSRRGKVFSWKLQNQFSKVAPNIRVQEAFLERWLIESRNDGKGLQTVRIIQKKYPQQARSSTLVWGTIGNVLMSSSLYRETAKWLSDWQTRPDARGWMVTNLVFALHAQKRTAQADAVSLELLKRELRDHTTSFHLSYLTLSALEKRATAEARAYFTNIRFEGKNAANENYIRDAIKAALRVQEIDSVTERKSIFESELQQLRKLRTGKKFTPQMIAMEARAIKQMGRDSGKRLPALYVPKTGKRREPLFNLSYSLAWRLLVIGVCLVLVLAGVVSQVLLHSSPTSAQPATANAVPPAPNGSSVPAPSPSLPRLQPPVPSLREAPLLSSSPSAPGAPASASSLPPNLSVNELMDKEQYLETHDGKINDITDCFNQIFKSDPQNILALSRFSSFALRLRQFPEAVQAAQNAVAVDPHSKVALNTLCYALYKSGRLNEAQAVARQTQAVDPHSFVAFLAMGAYAMSTNDWDRAIDQLNKAVTALPTYPEVWKFLVTCYHRNNQVEEGEAEFKALLQTYPDSEPGWLSLGNLQSIGGDQTAALQSYNKAIAINSQDGDLWNSVGLAYSKSNQLDKGLEAFRKSVSLLPKYDEAWNNLGYTYYQLGDYPKAEDALKQALAANPRHSRALTNLVRTYVKEGNLDLAQKTCDELVTIDPDLAASVRTEIK